MSLDLDKIKTPNKNNITIVNGEKTILSNYYVNENTPIQHYSLSSENFTKHYNNLKNNNLLSKSNIDLSLKNLEYLLDKVLKNVTVGSKRFLTNKVDRSVTGLVAQQQCVGPLHTPLSNFGLFSSINL